jgi:hypothetical protein
VYKHTRIDHVLDACVDFFVQMFVLADDVDHMDFHETPLVG